MNILVAARVRPLLPREKKDSSILFVSDNTLTVESPGIIPTIKAQTHVFTFDHSLWSANTEGAHYASQEKVFETIGEPLYKNILQGYNTTLITYGQTGSGKSYTIQGTQSQPGLIPRIMNSLLRMGNSCNYWISYLEIYDENLRDLLDPSTMLSKSNPSTPKSGLGETSSSNLSIYEHSKLGTYISGLTECNVSSIHEYEKLIDFANKKRIISSRLHNNHSTRSHVIFIIRCETINVEKVTISSKMYIIDLGGSEQSIESGTVDPRRKIHCDTMGINKSLSHLNMIVKKISTSKLENRSRSGRVTPEYCDNQQKNRMSMEEEDASYDKLENFGFKNSKLTFLLKESLTGNHKTFLIATVSPAEEAYGETMMTLRFAQLMKKLKTQPRVNRETEKKFLITDIEKEREILRTIMGLPTIGHKIPEVYNELCERKKILKELHKSTQTLIKEEEERKITRRATLNEIGLTEMKNLLNSVERDVPVLHNISEDPLLNGSLIYFLRLSHKITIGTDSGNVIVLNGLDIKPYHGVFYNSNNSKVTFMPCEGARTLINGEIVDSQKELKEFDIVIIGRGLVLRFLPNRSCEDFPPSSLRLEGSLDRNSLPIVEENIVTPPTVSNSDLSEIKIERQIWDNEINPLTSSSYQEFQNYIDEMKSRISPDKMIDFLKILYDLCPKLDTANMMAAEILEIPLIYELECIWDIYNWKGDDFLLVRVKLKGECIYFWTVKKFLSRYEQMEDIYQTTKKVNGSHNPFLEVNNFEIWEEKNDIYGNHRMDILKANPINDDIIVPIISSTAHMYSILKDLSKETKEKDESPTTQKVETNSSTPKAAEPTKHSAHQGSHANCQSRSIPPIPGRSNWSSKNPVKRLSKRTDSSVESVTKKVINRSPMMEKIYDMVSAMNYKMDQTNSAVDQRIKLETENVRLKIQLEEMEEQLRIKNETLQAVMPSIMSYMSNNQNQESSHGSQSQPQITERTAENLFPFFTNLTTGDTTTKGNPNIQEPILLNGPKVFGSKSESTIRSKIRAPSNPPPKQTLIEPTGFKLVGPQRSQSAPKEQEGMEQHDRKVNVTDRSTTPNQHFKKHTQPQSSKIRPKSPRNQIKTFQTVLGKSRNINSDNHTSLFTRPPRRDDIFDNQQRRHLDSNESSSSKQLKHFESIPDTSDKALSSPKTPSSPGKFQTVSFQSEKELPYSTTAIPASPEPQQRTSFHVSEPFLTTFDGKPFPNISNYLGRTLFPSNIVPHNGSINSTPTLLPRKIPDTNSTPTLLPRKIPDTLLRTPAMVHTTMPFGNPNPTFNTLLPKSG